MADHCHNIPGMPGQTSRRNLLKALPAVAVLPALTAVPAIAAPETPVMAAFREWDAMNAMMNGAEGMSMAEPEFNAGCQALDDLNCRLMELPAQNAQDIVAKVISWTDSGGFELPNSDHPFWNEARALVGGAA